MRVDSHLRVAKAKVRHGELSRHAALRLEGGRVWAISSALAPPRLWSYATTAALRGFVSAYGESAPGSLPDDRLANALDGARESLVDAADVLIERQVPDATLVALLFEQGVLHVVAAGPGRVYVQRAGVPKRLTPREDARGGLLEAEPTKASMQLEPGDLVLAGSVSAFSVRAVARLAAVLEADVRAAPSVLVDVLVEPASLAGIGAAAAAVRVV